MTQMRLRHRDYDAAVGFVAEVASSDGPEPFEASAIEGLLRLIRADKAGYYEFKQGWEHPSRNTFYVTVSGQPLRPSDFLNASEMCRNPWYHEVQRPRGVIDEMKGWIPAPAGVTRAFYFTRTAGPTFTERDRAVLALLLAHLSGIRERWERRHRPDFLTVREAEILTLTAAGLTNAQIAGTLFLSRSTVRTHLEHIFEKLDVHSRTAAVAWLQARR